MIEYIIPVLAVFLGFTLATITQHEKAIYSKKQYFPLILIILAISAITFFIINIPLATALTFIFLITLIWWGV